MKKQMYVFSAGLRHFIQLFIYNHNEYHVHPGHQNITLVRSYIGEGSNDFLLFQFCFQMLYYLPEDDTGTEDLSFLVIHR